MSAPNFTPGPWGVDRAPSALRLRVYDAIEGGLIAIVGLRSVPAHPQDLANACLIAAAPDGYVAAVRALSLLDDAERFPVLDERDSDELDAVIADLKAFIAKAGGK